MGIFNSYVSLPEGIWQKGIPYNQSSAEKKYLPYQNNNKLFFAYFQTSKMRDIIIYHREMIDVIVSFRV